MRLKFTHLLPIFFLFACSSSKDVVSEMQLVEMDTLQVSALPDPIVFKGSEKRENDLLHTKLDLKFNWQDETVQGKAQLKLTPYRWPISELELDAQGFEFKSIKLNGNPLNKSSYTYQEDVLTIQLDKTYNKGETYEVEMEYSTLNNQRPSSSGGTAITDDKGIYFIKPDSVDRSTWQIWTQGEPEANSAWFPTIDSPNEKMTQEIMLTVDTMYETLSNGIMIFETDNNDGTKTALWKMDQPHSPYLAMLAIGDFAVIKDKWRDLEVNYYVDHDYAEHAQSIFGNTPEMLTFYSELLDYPYPWSKYSQVAVKDFVSGAMENTTAVIHGDFILQTTRELIDDDYEDFIAHELFHHWFGDLITCESWANIALNESFATYGEYLWMEHKYGQDHADDHLSNDLQAYLREAATDAKKTVRFDYKKEDDMFNSHTYQRGGMVLHMLRDYLGDEVFFTSVRTYIKQYAFQNTEIHELRRVFEEVSGEDLTWFFNQWFMQEGHPNLNYNHSYDSLNQTLTLNIEQNQNFSYYSLFRIPLKVDIYYKDTVMQHMVWLNEVEKKVELESEAAPLLVNFDASKVVICEKKDVKTNEEWMYMFRHAPLYLDRLEAAKAILEPRFKDKHLVFNEGLKDEYWGIRQQFVMGISSLTKEKRELFKDALLHLSQNDPNSFVRAEAIDVLAENYNDDNLEGLFLGAIQDSSYEVVSTALVALFESDVAKGLSAAKPLENEQSKRLILTLASLYSKHGGADQHDFYANSYGKIKGFERFFFFNNGFLDYVEKQSDAVVLKSMPFYREVIASEKAPWIKVMLANSLAQLSDKYEKRQTTANEKLADMKDGDTEQTVYRDMLKSAEEVLNEVESVKAYFKTVDDSEKIHKILDK